MEETNNMTAERSLKIITEQIEQSRKEVSKEMGQSLFVAGLCTMGMALLIALCHILTGNPIFYLLYYTMPIVILAISRYLKRGQAPVPSSFVGTMVNKAWHTFAIFGLSFFVFAELFNILMVHTESVEVYSRLLIRPFRIILILMGMCITITGYILKSKWLVWCGIIGGIGGYFWETFGGLALLSRSCSVETALSLQKLDAGIIIAIFAFVGLTLPGLMLKKQK